MIAMSNFDYGLWTFVAIVGLIGWLMCKAAKDAAGTSVGNALGNAALKKWFS